MKRITRKQPHLFVLTFLFFPLLSLGQVGIGIVSPLNAQFTVNEDAIFNESGGDFDFRIESNANPNMFNIDAANNVFGFNDIPNNVTIDGLFSNQVYDVFEIGNDGGTGSQLVGGFYYGFDPSFIPEQDAIGYSGYWQFFGDRYAWWESNAYAHYNISSRGVKRNIVAIEDDQALWNYVMDDIDQIKPSFYKYIHDLDEMVTGKENKYRPQMRIGVITDDSPDYITDPTNSKIDVYAISTLSLAGVKHNRERLNQIEQQLTSEKISDFGSVELNGSKQFVEFDSNFRNKLTQIPVITLSNNDPNVRVSIVEKSKTGFLIVCSAPVTGLNVDWIAMSKISVSPETAINNETGPVTLKSKLEIPESVKATLRNYYSNLKPSRGETNDFDKMD